MASTFLNLSTDNTLGGNSPSDFVAVSQKAIKTYVDNNSGGGSSYTAGTGIDITNDVISVTAPTLTNTTRQGNAVHWSTVNILGGSTSSVTYTVCIGVNSNAGNNSVAVGYNAKANSANSIAIGPDAITSASYAIQLGFGGTNSEANSLYVATSYLHNWKLLGDDGYIPTARIDSETTSEVTLATVATSGSYNDLSNKPTIPTVNNPTITITQGGVTKGSFTLNQASGDTIALDAGGGGAVDSVNGYTGTVVLAPSDLGITEYTANEVETLWSSL